MKRLEFGTSWVNYTHKEHFYYLKFTRTHTQKETPASYNKEDWIDTKQEIKERKKQQIPENAIKING